MYAQRYARPSPRVAADARACLLAHDFPGNVRELEHWIESAIVLAPDGVIRASAFPAADGAPRTPSKRAPNVGVEIALGQTLEDAERAYARAVVKQHEGNKTEAAKALGIGRNTLARLLKDST
jgi:Nif-specific regulatory protein